MNVVIGREQMFFLNIHTKHSTIKSQFRPFNTTCVPCNIKKSASSLNHLKIKSLKESEPYVVYQRDTWQRQTFLFYFFYCRVAFKPLSIKCKQSVSCMSQCSCCNWDVSAAGIFFFFLLSFLMHSHKTTPKNARQ